MPIWTTNIPTLSQLKTTMRGIWQGLRPTADTSRGSDVWLLFTWLAPIVLRLHWTLERGIQALHPATTWGVYLDWWLRWVGCPDGLGGFGRIVARGSSGTDALAVVATATGGTVTSGDLLTDPAGRTYQFTETYVFPAPGETVFYPKTVHLSVAAVDTGLVTNLEAGTLLTFVSPPLNVTPEATLVLDLDGGVDLETDPEGRVRLLARLRDPSLSANPAQIREVVDAVTPGNLRAYLYPKRQNAPNGAGTVDIALLQTGESGAARIATEAQGTAVGAAILASLPVSLWRNWRLLYCAEQDTGGTPMALTYELAPAADPSSACDWDAESLRTTVAGSTEGDLLVQAGDDVSSLLEAGDRIVINGVEGLVASVTADEIVLESWPWPTGTGPTVGHYIQSGGGAGALIRTAVAALVDTLGPARGTYADATDRDWDDTVRVKWLQKVAMNASVDVLDVVVLDIGGGVVDYTPADDDDTEPAFVSLGELVIWELK